MSKKKRKREIVFCDQKKCIINSVENRASCGECRFKKCLRVGMSISRIRYGRHVSKRNSLSQRLIDNFYEFRQNFDTFMSSHASIDVDLFNLFEKFCMKSINLINADSSSTSISKSNTVKLNLLYLFFCTLFDIDLLEDNSDTKYQLKTSLKTLMRFSFLQQTNSFNELKCLCFMQVMLNFIQDNDVILFNQSIDKFPKEQRFMDMIKIEFDSSACRSTKQINNQVESVVSFVELVQWLTQIQNVLNSHV